MNWWQRLVNRVLPGRVERQRVYLAQRQGGVMVNEDTALTFAAVWACVSVIARTVAALPWHVYERQPGGNRRKIDGDVAWLLNNRPNSEMTAFSLREALMLHVLTWGNGYCEIDRNLAGRVRSLWLISPERVSIARNAAGELVYTVRGEFETVQLPAADVLHLHGMGFDGICGYSPVRMAARSMGIGMAQDVFGQAFYANGTVMGTIVELPANMKDDQIATAEKYLNDTYRGPDKAFSVKVAPGGSKVNNLSMPMTDAQFLESRKFSVTEVCRWYGVPPHKVADLDRSTNNNIEHQGIEFATDTIVPWAIRLEQEANTKLFSSRAQGRVYTKLAVNGLMRGDSKSRAEFYRLMTQMGVMSINEVRAMEDLNGIGPDGDVRLVQLNQTTLEHLVENPGSAASAPAEPAADPKADDEPGADLQDPSEPDAGGKTMNVIRLKALEFSRSNRA